MYFLLNHGYLHDFHWPELSSTEGLLKYDNTRLTCVFMSHKSSDLLLHLGVILVFLRCFVQEKDSSIYNLTVATYKPPSMYIHTLFWQTLDW